MALGREVADAYISVHGDLAPFRRDLEGAEKAGRAAAVEAAKSFNEEWARRSKDGMASQWHDMVSAMYNDDTISWKRLLGDVDTIDDTFAGIVGTMTEMREGAKLSNDEYNKMLKTIGGVVQNVKQAAEVQDRLNASLKEHAELMDRATKQAEAYGTTLSGMRNLNAISDMEKDFKKLAETMKSADMEKFAKGFDSLEDAEKRINDVTAAMEAQRRITSEQADELKANMSAYIDSVRMQKRLEEEAAAAKSKAMKDALDETNRLRIVQDKYNASLSGMARNYHFGKLEQDFRQLAAAMDSADFSHFARGATDIEHMRRNIVHTANEMRRLGRMTDTEYGLILDRVEQVNHAFGDGARIGGNFFRTLRTGANRFGSAMSGLNRVTKGFREHLQGFAGLNVFGDMIRKGLDFVHNLDRIALNTAKVSTLLGSMASIGGSSLAGLVVIAADLGATLGGLGAALPAFLVGAGIGIAVLVAALKDTKEVLADLKQPLAEFQDSISRDFWREAADPIRAMAKHLLPILHNPKGTSTATSLGRVFKSLAESITAIPADKINTMFDRMNGAIDDLAPMMPPLIRAFTNLGMVGSGYFSRFSKWIVKLTEDFDTFIQKAFDNGDINKWIDTMIEGFRNIGRTIDGALGMFNAIASAARAAGSGGLKEFADKLQGMAAVMQSPAFQTTLTSLFLGMNTAVAKIGQSIRNLGPALQSVMPTVQRALTDIGTVAGRVIDYFGMILSNPLIQKGITDFSNSMVQAINRLEPAIKPFGDSLGTMLTLLGEIAESVGQVATTFFVELSPVLDRISTKMGTLVKPLADGVSKFIEDMKGPLEKIETVLVGPLVSAINDKILPALTGPGGFSEEFSKFVSRLVEAAGPSFKTLVDEVLPNLVTTVTALLDPLGKFVAFFTPTLNQILKETADGIRGIGDAAKFMKGEIPIGEIEIFKPGALEKGAKDAEQEWKDVWENRGQMSWGDIFARLVEGPSEAGQALGIMLEKVWNDAIVPGITKIFNGTAFGDEVKKNLDDFWRDDRSIKQDIADGMKKWWHDNVDRAFEDAGRAIGQAWDDTIGKFWDGIFGNKPDAGNFGGGGGTGGRAMGVGGKLDPAMLGLPDEEGTKSWFTEFGTWLWDGFTGALGRLGEALGLNTFAEQWTLFWDAFPVKVQEVWDAIVLWVTTKAGEVKTAIDTFIADAQLNWALFWDAFPVKVQEVWDAIVLWINTKVAEIKLAIDTWTAQAALDWGLFWDGLNTKVTEIWDAIKLWIETKVGEIKTTIETWSTDLTKVWDDFWNGAQKKADDVWDAITRLISGDTSGIRKIIDDFGAEVKRIWDGFWTEVDRKVDTAWEGIKSGVSAGIEGVITFFREMPQKITNQFSNMWGEMSAIGDTIWRGLKAGIEGGIEWVKTAARNLATAAVTAAKMALEVNSPSKVFRRLGLSGGEGMAQGFNWSESPVAAASRSMADVATAAFAHSKMYLAGADAALGLADGLEANKSKVMNALGEITPDLKLGARINTAGGVGGATPPAQKIITIEKGAVQVTTPTRDPELVASKVIDRLVINSNL